jgi:hypothetical protein
MIVAGLLAIGIIFAWIGVWQLGCLLMAAALLLGLFKFGKWAFWPRHELPRHRVRHQRIRLFLRLHPGRGHATLAELYRHWSSRASAEKDRYARP